MTDSAFIGSGIWALAIALCALGLIWLFKKPLARVTPNEPDSKRAMTALMFIVAVFMMSIFAFCLRSLIYVGVPTENHDVFLVLVGVLARDIGTIINFLYSATVGNRAKDETIALATTTIAKAQDALPPVAGATGAATTTTAGNVNVELPPGATAKVHAGATALVKPIEVSQSDWDAMTDVDKAAVVLRYAK